MNWGSAALWGFVATIVLTILLSASQGLGLTRISLPYMLGTMITSDRDKAKSIGFAMHLLNGWLFAVVYAAAFESWGRAGWGRGAVVGLIHASFVLTAGMRFLPGIHPRMASEQEGPEMARGLEPPGFFALNYGYQTPVAVLLAHAVYGAVLGAFYTLHRA
jgi:hypothetical protein